MLKKKNKIRKIQSNSKIKIDPKYAIIMTTLAIGIILGIVYSFVINIDDANIIKEKIIARATMIGSMTETNNLAWQIKVIYENLKLIIIIAFIGYFTTLSCFIPIVIMYKGFLYGFSISFIIRILHILGLKLTLATYVPFALIYILLNILLGKITIDFIKTKSELKGRKLEYFIKVMLIAIIVIVFSIIEINVVPNVINMIIN